MTHTEIIEKVKESMTPDLPVSQSAIDSLEEGLLGADIGAELTMSLIDRIEQRVRDEKIHDVTQLTAALRDETRSLIPNRAATTIDVSRAKPEDAGKILSDQLVKFMQRLKIPRGLRAVGYDDKDIPALVKGTLPQARVTRLAPRPASEDDLAHLFEESMQSW